MILPARVIRARGRGGTGGGIVSYTHGADSEAGRLRTVLVHRPGAELERISPHSRGRLLFDRLPWVARAQQEHDALTQVLRDHGVEVLYVTELLQDALEYAPARAAAISSALDDRWLGDDLRAPSLTISGGSTRRPWPRRSSPGSPPVS